ncbi:hypothetical protein ACFSX9_16045 [Flavobacterium ardleyense]|uniref:Lipoprotein n=1 Tax=Flavobacterium ardleyense TaxID=2038737 RepID=A0ABW5ZBS4_9FLAO
MRIIFIILFICLLFANCKKNNSEFNNSEIKEINDIVKIVILEDSLNVLKSESESKMFCENLIKLNIYIPEKRKENEPIHPLSPSFNNVSIENLIYYKIENKMFFTNTDSLFLLKQNLKPNELKIENKIIKKLNVTSKKIELEKKKIGKSYNYYEMTIPAFSKDNQKAYLELNHYCGNLCGSGKSIYLKKVNGKWKIVDKRRTWIS